MDLKDSGIRRFLIEQSPMVYYHEGWRQTIEDHLPWLQARSQWRQVDPFKAHVFHNDLTGYLTDLGIPQGKHWLIMRLNDFHYNWDFEEDRKLLLIPHDEDIDHLTNCFMSSFQST